MLHPSWMVSFLRIIPDRVSDSKPSEINNDVLKLQKFYQNSSNPICNVFVFELSSHIAVATVSKATSFRFPIFNITITMIKFESNVTLRYNGHCYLVCGNNLFIWCGAHITEHIFSFETSQKAEDHLKTKYYNLSCNNLFWLKTLTKFFFPYF